MSRGSEPSYFSLYIVNREGQIDRHLAFCSASCRAHYAIILGDIGCDFISNGDDYDDLPDGAICEGCGQPLARDAV